MTVPLSQLFDDREQRLADWGETIQPAIYDGVSLYHLPRPILKLRIRDAWDFERFKVPLADGDVMTGHSQQGVEIVLEGQVGSQDDESKLSAQEMFAELETLRSALNVDDLTGKYSFFLFHDAAAGYYRKFKSCSTVRFEFGLTHRVLYSYSAVIHADDPVIYTTAPGS